MAQVTKSATAVRNSSFNSIPLAALLTPWIVGLVAWVKVKLPGIPIGDDYALMLTGAVVAAVPVFSAWWRTKVIDRFETKLAEARAEREHDAADDEVPPGSPTWWARPVARVSIDPSTTDHGGTAPVPEGKV